MIHPKENPRGRTDPEHTFPPKPPAGPPAAVATATAAKSRPPTRDCPLCSDLSDASAKRHYPSDCPRLPAIRDLVKDGTIAAALAQPVFESDAVVLAAHAEPVTSFKYLDLGVILAAVTVRLKWYHVLLDNQASVSCFKNMLRNITPAQVPLRINGVGGSILTDRVGTLEIYHSKEILANVLCFAQVADIYTITWDQDAMAFVVHTGDQNIHFFRKGDIFVADFRPILLGQQDEQASSDDDDNVDDAEDNSDGDPPDHQSDEDRAEDSGSDGDDNGPPGLVDNDSSDDEDDHNDDVEFSAIVQVNTVEKFP